MTDFGTTASSIDESALTKGQLRKLNVLRKSVGPEIGERAFAEWLASQAKAVQGGQEPGGHHRRPLTARSGRQAPDPAWRLPDQARARAAHR